MAILTATKKFEIRFSEIDTMRVVWHGSYPLYFEDAREAFGAKYGISYNDIENNGYFAPLVELTFHYKKSITYDMHPQITITYCPTSAAKIVFDYVITNPANGSVMATGRSVQVFLDSDRQLVLNNPPFYQQWKKRWNVTE